MEQVPLSKPQYLTLVPMFDELRSERVVVRPYSEEDAPALCETMEESRDHLRPWLPFADEHRTVDEARDWINRMRARWILREGMPCGLFDAATGQMLGGVGLHPHDWAARSFEVGYWLRPSAEGHGYMIEAVRMLVDYTFAELQARRVEIQCDSRNNRSASVAQRLGFVQEGHMRNDFVDPIGILRSTLLFSMTPEDRT